MSDLSEEYKKLALKVIEDVTDFSVENVIEILPELMSQVDKLKKINAEGKKALVLKMLRHLVDITDGPGNDAVWDPIIKSLLPGMLDLLVSTNKGKLTLKKQSSCLRLLKLLKCSSR